MKRHVRTLEIPHYCCCCLQPLVVYSACSPIEAIGITVHWTPVGYPACQNGGMCSHGFCYCPPGFEGAQCETGTLGTGCECAWGGVGWMICMVNKRPLSWCTHHPELEPCGKYYCSNGGECVNGTSCHCAAGFGGDNCDLVFCECHACM